MKMRFGLLLLLCSSVSVLAQQTMTTESVVKLQNAGVADPVIVQMIDTSPCHIDTSSDGVIALKNAGVHDPVVIAIINRMHTLTHPRPPYEPQAADPDDPSARHDAGVYLMSDAPDGSQKMLFIDRVGESAMRVSNMAGAAFSFGTIKMKLKADIPGAHAATRTGATRPVFYIYFPDVASFGGFGGVDMITSPGQFSLLALEEKPEMRETVVASAGITGGSIGADQKRTVPFTTERVRPLVYKVTPSADLKPGEYAFIATMPGVRPETPPTVVAYDFGIDPTAIGNGVQKASTNR